MIYIPYYFGNCPIAVDEKHKLLLTVFTDLPVWNFRIYNNIDRRKATKMLRFMLTKPAIIDLWEPNKWIPTKDELKSIDIIVKKHWKDILIAYNEELDEDAIKIPLDLVKPDYTKTVIEDISISGYCIRLD